MKEHLASGRGDHRGDPKRAELLTEGVPVETRPASARKRPDVSMRHLESLRARPAGATESTSMTANNTGTPIREDLPSPSPENSGRDNEDNERCVECGLFDIGDDRWPVRDDTLRSLLHGGGVGAGFGGIAAKGNRLRAGSRNDLLVLDAKAIPDAKAYELEFGCDQLHRGLCATDDADVYDDAIILARNLERSLRGDGYFIRIDDPHEVALWPCISVFENLLFCCDLFGSLFSRSVPLYICILYAHIICI